MASGSTASFPRVKRSSAAGLRQSFQGLRAGSPRIPTCRSRWKGRAVVGGTSFPTTWARLSSAGGRNREPRQSLPAPPAGLSCPRASKRGENRRPADRRPERAPARDSPGARIGIGVGVLSLAVYLLTLDTSLPTGDSGELISAAAVLGIAHPPGYPLFTLLGRLALLLPVGSDALRVNVLSALLDATAVSIVYFAIHAVLVDVGRGASAARKEIVAAAVGALLLAYSTTFWAYATVAEVFALNDLFAASLSLLAFRWVRNPSSARLGCLCMFVLGLSLCNQETIVLIIPGLAVLAWLGVRRIRAESPGWRPRARTLAIGLAAFVAGLAPYVYIPIAASRVPARRLGEPDQPRPVRRSDPAQELRNVIGRHGETLGLTARPALVLVREPRPGLHRGRTAACACWCDVGVATAARLAWRWS